MSTARKIGLLVVSVISCGLLSTGCTSAQSNTGNSSSAQDTTGKSSAVPVTMFAPTAAGVINMNTNSVTKYVEKKFNLNITWNLVDSSDLSTKQSLLLESGQYPDVFWNSDFTPQQVLQYGQEGIFKPLNSLIKEYAPNVWHAIQTNAAFRQAAIAPDGNIYALPSYGVCLHCSWSQKMWINGYWLKKLNLPLPTTTAQFEQVLEAFKAHNLVPLTGYTGGWNSNPVPYLMNAFIYDDNTDYFDVENGKITFAADQPQWKVGLEYIHDLYQKGLLPASAFTQSTAQVTKLVANNEVGAMPGGTANVAFPGSSGVPWQYWETAVPPLKGPNGAQFAAFDDNLPQSADFAITNKASEAQTIAVLKLVNYEFTLPGLELSNFGPPGKWWSPAKKGQKGLSGQQAYGNINNLFFSQTSQNQGWNGDFPSYQPLSYFENTTIAYPPYAPDGSGAQSLLQLVTEEDYAGHQPKEVYPGWVWMPTAEAQQYALDETNINNYVTTWTMNFILGRKSLTTDWNQYVQGFNGLGLSQYLGMAQKYMGSPFITTSFEQDVNSVKYLLSIPEPSSAVKWVVTPPQYAKYESWAKH